MVLNYNGLDHLDACLDSLGALDVFVPGRPGQPRDPLARDEVWLLDNCSSDASVRHVTRNHPWVRLIESDANLGFSRAYNRAAAMCDSEYLVFLNNDTRVGPGWLSALHRTREAHPGARAVAGRIMSWDGKRIDFAGADTFFSGHAMKRGLGDPAGEQPLDEVPLLFGCAGALMFHRETFIGIGAFDQDYFSFFEDVDLGWRASLLGHTTWFSPDAVVLHKHHGSWGAEPTIRVLYLTERNALFNVFKNYHRERMGVMLLLSAALTFLRAWFSSDSLRALGRPFLTSGAIAHMLALANFLHFGTALRARRDRIQADRRRLDEEILSLFGAFASPPTALGEEYKAAFARLRDAAGIADDRIGGPWSADLNALAEESALLIAGVCSFAVGAHFPPEAFLAQGWDPDWEHQLPSEAAQALAQAHAAIAGFAESGITAESLASLRDRLRKVRPVATGVKARGVPPSVRRFGRPAVPQPEAALDRPSVSVVVRTKDRPEFLRRALASVAAQAYPRIEVVVVNDGGKDPAPVLAEFEGAFPIVLLTHTASLGRSRAAQVGLAAATGELANFLDDDDEFLPGHLDALVGTIASTGVRVAYSDVECVTEEPDGAGGFRVVDRSLFAADLDPSRLLFEGTIPMMAVLMDRKLALEVGGFDPELDYFEDWDLWLRLVRRTRFQRCPQVTAVYHVCQPLNQGKGTAGNHRWTHLARFFDRHHEYIRGRDWARYYRRQVEPVRQRLREVEQALAALQEGRRTVEPKAEYLQERLETIEGSLGWRLYQGLRRLLGRQ